MTDYDDYFGDLTPKEYEKQSEEHFNSLKDLIENKGENMSNRLLLESEVIKAVDKHIDDSNKLDDDISCILEEVETATVELPPVFLDRKVENKLVEKEKRIQLYENEDIVLEQRGNNKYYLSLYNKEGKFQREVTIAVKDDYTVSLFNDK